VISGEARDIDDYRDVAFTDCPIKVLNSLYKKIKELYGIPERMTYDTFKQYVMLEEL